MDYQIISADCHIDLPWLPPDLFVEGASAALRDRMPYVTDGQKGPMWVTRGGASFGLQNGMGSAGREYVPGQIHRSDRMAEQGLYEDGRNGIRRISDPDLRLKDQDLDGIQAEVLYGILGASMRLGDETAAAEMMRVYNAWLADFCATHPERYAGLACIPNHDVDAAVAEIERVANAGVLRGIEIANTHEMPPLFDPVWEPVWARAESARLPVHFHTVGPPMAYDFKSLAPLQRRQAFACYMSSFQLPMANHGAHLRWCAGVASRHASGDWRKRHRLDSLHPRAHGPGVGGSIQGPDADDEAVGVLAPPVSCHLSE